MPRAKTVPKSKSELYSVVLSLGGKEYKIEAPTILEAVNQLSPTIVKGRGTITVSKGAEKTEIMMYPFQLRRLFVNRTMREIFEKRMLLAMK